MLHVKKAAATALLCAGLALLSCVPSLPAAGAGPRTLSVQPGAATNTAATQPAPEQLFAAILGTWRGAFPVRASDTEFVNDTVLLDMVSTDERKVLVSYSSYDIHYMRPNEWHFEDGVLVFTLYGGGDNDLATVRLKHENNKTLKGTYDQYGKIFDVTFQKISDQATDGENYDKLVFEGVSEDEWLSRLRQYPKYAEDGVSVRFTYELYRWDKSLQLINRYGLQDVMNSNSDVDLMIALLNVVCDNFTHDGDAGMPEEWDALSVANYCVANGGVDCRGVSIILAEMLRTCGIPARTVMCIPNIDPCEESHVVVQAYSQERGQWILLDPTYRLILKDERGNYVNLQSLRRALIDGAPLFPNENAGHNKEAFDMNYYRAYMSKNTFRFTCATDYYFGGENNSYNKPVMLVPAGWPVPYQNSRPERVTTSEQAFWAPPQ